jgi:hypothetical protein
MKADIGRMTFDPAKNFARVVLQQGRVQLESDWNEQVAILVHALRTLAADLIGPWGGTPGAFAVAPKDGFPRDVEIGSGVYYVDGVRVENLTPARYEDQPFYPVPEQDHLTSPSAGGPGHYLLYLDVWEQLVTADQDEDLRDVALGGLDTAARTRTVWQVRALSIDEDDLATTDCEDMTAAWPEMRDRIAAPRRGRLRARARITAAEADRPCTIDPRASYRFDENALFRVEVHRGGPPDRASLKWSLDNGSVALPVESFGGGRLRLATLGRDPRMTLDVGDHVELESDDYVLANRADPLLRVTRVDPTSLTVDVTPEPTPVPADQHPRLRRWDQKRTAAQPLAVDSTLPVVEAGGIDGPWIDLAHGVQVQLVAEADTTYRTGDFWVIEARTVIGDVVWPQEPDAEGRPIPRALPPRGVEHHYAPLARVTVAAGSGAVDVVQRYVRAVTPVATCPTGT